MGIQHWLILFINILIKMKSISQFVAHTEINSITQLRSPQAQASNQRLYSVFDSRHLSTHQPVYNQMNTTASQDSTRLRKPQDNKIQPELFKKQILISSKKSMQSGIAKKTKKKNIKKNKTTCNLPTS